jgi:hypothetical protein
MKLVIDNVNLETHLLKVDVRPHRARFCRQFKNGFKSATIFYMDCVADSDDPPR